MIYGHMILLMMSYLAGSAVLDQGRDHQSSLRIILFQAKAKTCIILE